jgi:glycerol-3-phosphate dehydrogenase
VNPEAPDPRQLQLAALEAGPLDVLIVGGGINGAGIARDLALRARAAGTPLRIGLVEQRQFASGTSGRNSQLIHGGLRYLRNLEFGLVRESLRERSTLLAMAPRQVRPLAFLMPFYSRRARFYYGAGLWLYDVLAGRHGLGHHRILTRAQAARMEPGLASEGLVSAAVFQDARVDAARFVLANVFEATRNGALAGNYLRAVSWEREGGLWRVRLEDTLSGETIELTARKLVDATGPWSRTGALRLVRGSHLILPRLTSDTHAIAWFEEGGRIVFVIPFGETTELSLVGTTDVDHEGGPDDVRISAEETAYLLRAARRLFPAAAGIDPVSAYSALRPLVGDEAAPPERVSREHRIWNSPDGVLHVGGGKYTTYRLISEQAGDMVAREIAPRLLGMHVTAETPLAEAEAPRERRERIAFAVRQDMARRLADLMFISTSWGYEQQWNAELLAPLAREMGAMLGWNAARTEQEIELVQCQTVPPGHS